MTFAKEAYLWQQCTSNDGQVGTFIAPKGRKAPISPVFADTAKFFDWAKENGWVPSVPGSFRYVFKGSNS